MVGELPKFLTDDRARRVTLPAKPRRSFSFSLQRWHGIAMVALCVPLSLVLVQVGKSPGAGMLAANTEAVKPHPGKSRASADRTSIDTFEDRFPTLQFADRFPTT